jgi:hypothetical protein
VAEHSAVDEIHITGSARTHDVILFGPGPEGDQRRRDNRPRTTKRMTSSGAACRGRPGGRPPPPTAHQDASAPSPQAGGPGQSSRCPPGSRRDG